MTKILLTGFEPWGDISHNPSDDLVRALSDEQIGGADLLTAILPVEYGEDTAVALPLIDEHEPDAVLSFGLGTSPCLSVEQVAINLRHDGSAIVEDGPDGYFASIPVEGIKDSILGGGVPARISYHAGAFLCNHIMYQVLHYTKKRVPSGFIHLPPTPDLAVAKGLGDCQSMSQEKIQEGAVLAIENLAEYLHSL